MPETHDQYRCVKCEHEFHFTEDRENICPACGGNGQIIRNKIFTFDTDTHEIQLEETPLPAPPADVTNPSTTDAVGAATASENILGERFRDKETKTITMLGYSNSGKSFLLNRLLHLSAQGDKFKPSHSGLDKITQTGKQDFNQYKLTDSSSLPGIRGRCDFRLVDLAGEYLVDILAGQNGHEPLIDAKEKAKAEIFYKAIVHADAFVFVIPAPHLFVREGSPGANLHDLDIHGGEVEDWNSGRPVLGQITTLFGVILAVQNLRSELGLKTLIEEGIGKEELEEVLISRKKIKVPVAITFSQTDRLVGNELARKYGVDGDPWRFAASVSRSFYKSVLKHCTRYRFSFTTAFEGHTFDSFEVDYTNNHHGVEDTFQWIFDELHDGPWPFSTLRNLLRGHSLVSSASQTTLRLRGLTDRNFRKHEKGKSS
jgi:hypothetical protein